MIRTHCRHRTYPAPGGPFPTTCLQGVRYAEVHLPGCSVIEGEPCTDRGRANGARCPVTRYYAWCPDDDETREDARAIHCHLTALVYLDRRGAKAGTTEEKDRQKADWYMAMRQHALGEGPDPRSSRPGFQPYRREPWDPDEDPDDGPLALRGSVANSP